MRFYNALLAVLAVSLVGYDDNNAPSLLIHAFSVSPQRAPALTLTFTRRTALGAASSSSSTTAAAKSGKVATFSSSTQQQQQQQQQMDISELQKQREYELRNNNNHDHVAWNRLFVNVAERSTPIPLQQQQQSQASSSFLPTDFPPGALLRLGPNAEPDPQGGFMDGDGMITCVTFPPVTEDNTNGEDSPDSVKKDTAVVAGTYSCTYVETRGRTLEAQKSARNEINEKKTTAPKFKGTLGAVPRSLPMLGALLENALTFQTLQCQKDTCNTALGISGNRILALMEQCPPSEIQIGRDGSVTTVQNNGLIVDNNDSSERRGLAWAPITGGALSAHGRTHNKERIHVSYSSGTGAPARVDFFQDNWELTRSVDIPSVPCTTMMHDCAVSENYVVLFDFPLTLRTVRFLKDEFPVQYEPSHGARIGLLPRNAQTDDSMLWFDVKPGVVLHAANAHERPDGTVVVHVLRSEPDQKASYLQEYAPSFLYEYVLDPTSKTVTQEACLNGEQLLEFPAINDQYTAQAVDHVYANHVRSIGGPLEAFKMPSIGITLDGITKLSLRDDATKGQVLAQYSLPERWFGVTEPTVVPKTTGEGEYLLLFATYVPNVGTHSSWKEVTDEDCKSRVIVLDGDDDLRPVWECDLPHHVNYGLHSEFVPWELMK